MRVQNFSGDVAAAKQAAQHITAILEGKNTIFVSGGSSFAVFEQLDTLLSTKEKSLTNLLLVDERYGQVNHADSNWELLGSIDLDDYASAIPVLEGNKSLEQAAVDYDSTVKSAFDSSNTIAILGIGSDRHIAGIKPMDLVEYNEIFSGRLVAGYSGVDFERITLTAESLFKINNIVVFVSGEEKQSAVTHIDDDTPINEAPANILSKLENVSVYNVINKGAEK